jgi:F-type H+-transporting ATPase subunit delta
LAKKNGIHVADVTTTHPLSSEQQEKLASHLGKMVGGTVRLEVEEDRDLLGGMIIKIGSRLIDASVQGKLVRVERQLKSQTEAA